VNVQLVLLVAYSAAQLALGAWISRRVKTAGDFFVAGRALGPGLLFSTMLAANIGAGSTVGTLSLAGPMMRFGEERRALYAACLAKASEELGNIWPLRNHRGLKPTTPASTTSNAPIQSKKIHVPSLTSVL
jgi:hypothetical protein